MAQPQGVATTRRVTGPAKSTGRAARKSGSRVASKAAGAGKQVTSRAADQAQDVASTAEDRSREVASVASGQARRVADTARTQAARVGEELAEQGKTLAEEARSHLDYQANAQSRRLADGLSKLGDEVRALAEGRPEDAETLQPRLQDAADAVYDAADRLYGVAQDVEQQGIGVVLADLQDFARRRPGAFLFGAAIAGFGLGRAVRASKDGDEASAGPGRV
jgi:hypothetical protein